MAILASPFVDTSKGEGGRAFGFVLAIGCGVACIAAIVLGIYAMTQKKSSKPVKTNSKSALVAPAGARHGQPARPT